MRTLPCTMKSAPLALSCTTGPSAARCVFICLVSDALPSPGAPVTGGDLHLGDAVVQAVRIGVLDAGEQAGDLRRGVARRLSQRGRRGGRPGLRSAPGCPRSCPCPRPSGSARVNIGTTVAATLFGGGRPVASRSCAPGRRPPAPPAPAGRRPAHRRTAGWQRRAAARRSAAAPPAAASAAARAAGRWRRDCRGTAPAGRRTMRAAAASSNRLRRTARTTVGSSAMMEIWCPIGPPPPSVRRRWLKNRASSAAVSASRTLTERMPAAASRAAQ